MSNHYRRQCLTMLLQLEPFIDLFRVISGIMANWYELINTFLIIIIHHGRKCLSFLK